MKHFLKSISLILLFSTFVFATGVVSSKIITDDKNNRELLNTDGATDIVDLSASNTNGLSVCNFKIKSLPDAKAGILYMEDGKTAVKKNQLLTQDEANCLMFDPKEGYLGKASFTYVGLGDNGEEGSLAKVTLPIKGEKSTSTSTSTDTSLVTTDDKVNPKMLNTLPAVDILNLSGKDGNGIAVDNFIIKSIVSKKAGILYMADAKTKVKIGQKLTKDEADGLKFDPKQGFIGDAIFTYQAVDVNGNLGNIAKVTIPVIGKSLRVVGTSVPEHNGTASDDCVCNDYNKSIPVLNNFGILLMFILISLSGFIFSREEI